MFAECRIDRFQNLFSELGTAENQKDAHIYQEQEKGLQKIEQELHGAVRGEVIRFPAICTLAPFRLSMVSYSRDMAVNSS